MYGLKPVPFKVTHYLDWLIVYNPVYSEEICFVPRFK
jgi:hypothetical protein